MGGARGDMGGHGWAWVSLGGHGQTWAEAHKIECKKACEGIYKGVRGPGRVWAGMRGHELV